MYAEQQRNIFIQLTSFRQPRRRRIPDAFPARVFARNFRATYTQGSHKPNNVRNIEPYLYTIPWIKITIIVLQRD